MEEVAPEAPQPPPAPRVLGVGSAALIFVGYVISQIVGAIPFALVGGLVALIRGDTDPDAMMASVLPLAIVGAMVGGGVGGWITARLVVGAPMKTARKAFGLVMVAPRENILATIAGAGFATFAILVIPRIVPIPKDLPDSDLIRMLEGGGAGLIVWAVIVILLAPPVEEFVFRGAMFHGLANRLGTIAAAVVITIVFTAIHALEPATLAWWPALLMIGTMGAIAVGFRIRTGSIVPAIWAHVAYNSIVVAAQLAGGN